MKRTLSVLVSVIVACVAPLAACDDDGAQGAAASQPAGPSEAPATTEPDRTDDEETAFVVCATLVDEANEMTRIANSTAAGFATLSPQERYERIISGFDAAARQVHEYADAVAEIELPDVPEREQLIAELVDGAQAGIDELADERERFIADVGYEVTDADMQGRVGEFFNSIEKVNSEAEPSIAGYERIEFMRAFLDEPECEHVIQPFPLDEVTATTER